MLDNHVDSTNTPPTLNGGRYVIAGVLGRGGNAGVYQGWDTHLKRWRAIKVLSHEYIHDDHVRARFAQEAATMARLDHPNLVKVFDISDDPFTPHIVMELCAGGSIIDWMKKHGSVPPRAACDVILATANAVSIAHEEDIIHRDIKPQNILIDHHGVVKLTDFGIARDENNSLTMAGQTMGTYAFMAPEQRHDSTTVDPRTDVYSLGATLFTLLAVKTTTELFVAEKGDEILGGIPEPLVDFILEACQYKPSNRFQDIAALVEALELCKSKLDPDPDHPPLQALASPLPALPPTNLPDLSALEDLLKSLALNHDERTYVESPHKGLDATTLGSSANAEKDRIIPYIMPSTTGSTPGPAKRTLSAVRSDPDDGPLPSYIDEDSFTSEPAPDRPLPADPTPETASPAEEEPQPEESSVTRPVVAVVVVATLLSLLFVAAVGMGALEVNEAAVATVRAEVELAESAEKSSPVIQLITQGGGDGSGLRDAYFAMKDATDTTRGDLALAYSSQLIAAADTLVLPRSAQALVADVAEEQETLQFRRTELRDATGSILGSLAVTFGVASARP